MTRTTCRRIVSRATAIMVFSIMASPVLAHHPLGGTTPETAMHGLLSGIGHPVIGFDHLAFIVGVGLLAALFGGRALLPAGFVAGTVAGTLLILGGVALPQAELVITASVLLVGIAAMLARTGRPAIMAGLAAIAGIFHGWAYGEAVIGAEATPVIAYLAGFGITQMAIAMGVMAAAGMAMRRGSNLAPRFAGAMVAGVGLTYLVEIAEAALGGAAVFAGL